MNGYWDIVSQVLNALALHQVLNALALHYPRLTSFLSPEFRLTLLS